MMRKILKWLLAACSSLVVGGTLPVTAVRATPASGFSGVTLTLGHFDEFDVVNHALLPAELASAQANLWMSMQRTKGPSDVYVQSNVWAAGGHTGWHTHPGHSLIIVTAGMITVYDGSCTPSVYTAGMGFLDEGGDHVHIIRNEGFDEARTIAVQVLPAGAVRRVDAAGPAACAF